MKIVKIIGGILAVLLLILTILTFVVPKDYNISVSRDIPYPSALLFKFVNTFQAWEQWDPWLKSDPTAKNTYEGPISGVGAKRLWTGEETGSGWMQINESVPGKGIKGEVHFDDFDSKLENGFTFEPIVRGTKVTWTAFGTMNRPWNIMNLFMKGNIEADYAKGLENLEKAAGEKYAAMIEQKERTPMRMLTIYKEVSNAEVPGTLSSIYEQISGYMKENAIDGGGPPFCIYHNYTPEKVALEAGYPIRDPENSLEGKGQIKGGFMPTGRFVSIMHVGSYQTLEETHNMLKQWIEAKNRKITGPPLEIYVNDPGQVQESELMTEVQYPVSE